MEKRRPIETKIGRPAVLPVSRKSGKAVSEGKRKGSNRVLQELVPELLQGLVRHAAGL